MPVCQDEEQKVNALIQRLADLEPDPSDSATVCAAAQRQMAPVRLQLAQAQSAWAACRKRHTWSEVRLRVVRMADDDGSNQTAVTEANMEAWIASANDVFTPARVRFLFDRASDFETRRNTKLNQLNPGTGESQDIEADDAAKAIGDEFPARVVVICRTSRVSPKGACGPGCGFSGYPGKYVAMPAYDANDPFRLAHEMGHYFGLSHTFRYELDTTHDAQVVFVDILGRNLDAIDGDAFNVADTPAELMIRDQDAGTAISIDLGGVIIQFLRKNVMSYYRPLKADDKTITAGQAAAVQTVLTERRNAGLQVNEVLID